MTSQTLEPYIVLYDSLEGEDLSEEYRDKEMQKISRKISNFFQSLESESIKHASTNIALLIYTHYNVESGKFRGIPYKGKVDRENVALDFDLKNISPILARILSKYIDGAFD
jgi:hypothetical protein